MNPFEFDHLNWILERKAWEEFPHEMKEARLAEIAYRTAEDIFDRVKDYCEKNNNEYDGEWIRCVADHSPDKFDEFINKYLNGEEAEELKRLIEENPDVYKSPGEFLNEVKLNYSVLWDLWMTSEIADQLGFLITHTVDDISFDHKLSSSCKIKRLKDYVIMLDNFRKAIKRASEEEKPLSKNKLYDWFMRLYDAGLRDHIYLKRDKWSDIVNYWLNYYDMLPDYDKLELLNMLYNNIIDAFDEMRRREEIIKEEKLSEPGVLTNER